MIFINNVTNGWNVFYYERYEVTVPYILRGRVSHKKYFCGYFSIFLRYIS